MKVLLIIPAYNEEENILRVCREIEEYSSEIDYVVINDGSKDNTKKILEENHLNHVNLVHNLGIGGAVQTGYRYAYLHQYDIAIQFDGDGQHDIHYVKDICQPILEGKANLVIGTRYLDKSKSDFQSTFMRRLGSRFIFFMIKCLCKQKITDPTSGFRAADKQVIEELSKEYPTDYPEPESTVCMLKKGYGVTEVPVNMKERVAGKSFVSPWTSIDYMIKVSLAIFIDSIGIKKGGKN